MSSGPSPVVCVVTWIAAVVEVEVAGEEIMFAQHIGELVAFHQEEGVHCFPWFDIEVCLVSF